LCGFRRGGILGESLTRERHDCRVPCAGYTAAIIAADVLGATGGPNANEVFLLAVARASEICIGIVSAGIVLAGTDFGGARRRLVTLFAALSAEITGRFTGMLAMAGPDLPETQPVRRELARYRITEAQLSQRVPIFSSFSL
jgi:Fusaric acid resistance protein family